MKNLGKYTRPDGTIVWRMFWTDNPKPKEIMIWVSTKLEPDYETNHITFTKTSKGFKMNLKESTIEQARIDFADVIDHIANNPLKTVEQIKDDLFYTFDFCDM